MPLSSSSSSSCPLVLSGRLLGTVLAALAYGSVTAGTVALINEHVVEPYMDEVFHLPQTMAFCAGKWSEWNPKITTLPGLYFVSVGLIRLSQWLPFSLLCSLPHLRLFNVLWSLVLFLLVHSILLISGSAKYRHSTALSLLKSAEVCTSPVLLFVSALYYTDLPSLCWILLTYLLSLSNSFIPASFCGLVAVIYRQTNIIWVALFAAFSLLNDFEQHLKARGEDSSLYHPSHFHEVAVSMLSLLRWFIGNLVSIVRRYGAFLLLAGAFLAFLLVNGGIVVGDRSHHRAALHLPQLLYFAGFACAFQPALSASIIRHRARVSLQVSPLLLVLALALLMVLMALSIRCCTYAHPFLLADNRHLTFYIWKNLFVRFPLFRYGLLPLYALAFFVLSSSLTPARSLLWQVLLFVFCSLALVPSPLIEFRYFIVPLVLLRLNECRSSTLHQLMHIAFNLALHASLLFVFLYKPFQWPDQSTARFMW